MIPDVAGCPSNIVQTVELGVPGAVVTWTAPTADDEAGIASIVPNIQPGTFFNVGETQQITYTITDNSGLVDTSCTFTVTVIACKLLEQQFYQDVIRKFYAEWETTFE